MCVGKKKKKKKMISRETLIRSTAISGNARPVVASSTAVERKATAVDVNQPSNCNNWLFGDGSGHTFAKVIVHLRASVRQDSRRKGRKPDPAFRNGILPNYYMYNSLITN